MIIIKTQGRVGNQLFQYAFAKNINITLYDGKEEITINYSNGIHKGFANKNILCGETSPFNIKPLKESKLKLNIIQKIIFWSYLLIRYIFKINKDVKMQSFFNHFGIYFLQDDLDVKNIQFKKSKYKNKLVYGFFASEDYFLNIKDSIKNDFKFNVELDENNKKFLEKIKKNNSVCISIRRGDYVNNEFFYVCNEKYYYDSIKKAQKEIENPLFVVFSDDVKWVEENMKLPNNTIYENQSNKVLETLYLMINCKHYIISNSTFHWWAQYLSKNEKDKKVYAPSIWNSKKTGKNIYQDNWTLININKSK